MPSTSLYPSSKNSWVVVSIIVYLCPCLGTHMFQWVAQPQIFTTISLTSKQSTLPTLPETNQIVHQNSKGCSDDAFLSAARGLFSEENKLEHLYFLESPVYNHRYQEMTFFFSNMYLLSKMPNCLGYQPHLENSRCAVNFHLP